jgi:hypothetical protein
MYNTNNSKWKQIRLILWLIDDQKNDLAVGYLLFCKFVINLENINPSATKRLIYT